MKEPQGGLLSAAQNYRASENDSISENDSEPPPPQASHWVGPAGPTLPTQSTSPAAPVQLADPYEWPTGPSLTRLNQPRTPLNYQPPNPPPKPKDKLVVPSGRPGAMALCATAALLFNIAWQSRLASIASLLGVIVCAAVIWLEPERRGRSVAVPLALAVGASIVTTLRMSPFVVFPALLVTTTSLIIASQDCLGRTRWLPVSRRLFEASVDVPRWAVGSVSSLDVSSKNRRSVVVGVALALVVAIPTLMLLASADEAFAAVLGSVSLEPVIAHTLLTLLAAIPIGALALSSGRVTDTSTKEPSWTFQSGAIESTVVLGTLAALLGLWCATQLAVAIGGAERFVNTADTTAANYTHQGFFQLVAVVGIVVMVFVAIDYFTVRKTAVQHRIFLALTLVIAAQTFALIWSTFARLFIYVDRFGHTMLRLSVAWFLAWLAVATLVIVALINRRTKRGFAVLYVSLALWVVAFGALNPEQFVATSNLDAATATSDGQQRLDVTYLTDELSDDAVPTLIDNVDKLDSDLSELMLIRLCDQSAPGNEFGFLGWNLSASQSAAAFDELRCP